MRRRWGWGGENEKEFEDKDEGKEVVEGDIEDAKEEDVGEEQQRYDEEG